VQVMCPTCCRTFSKTGICGMDRMIDWILEVLPVIVWKRLSLLRRLFD
jgi:hypothetical protein